MCLFTYKEVTVVENSEFDRESWDYLKNVMRVDYNLYCHIINITLKDTLSFMFNY